MSNNYRRLSDADLVDYLKNMADRLANHKVECFDNALSDDLAAALEPIANVYETVTEEAVSVDTLKQSVTATKATTREQALELISNVHSYLKSKHGGPSDYEILGFNFPKQGSRIIAQRPDQLTATATSYGVVFLKFRGNNKPGNVFYEIWRRQGDEGPWTPHLMTKRQRAQDSPVTPGQYYEYKVRAVAATNTSEFSDSVVIYGAM